MYKRALECKQLYILSVNEKVISKPIINISLAEGFIIFFWRKVTLHIVVYNINANFSLLL